MPVNSRKAASSIFFISCFDLPGVGQPGVKNEYRKKLVKIDWDAGGIEQLWG